MTETFTTRLSVQAIHTRPITVEGWHARPDEDPQDGGFAYWQVHEQETDEHGEFDVLTEFGNFVGIWYNAYACTSEDEFVERYQEDGADSEERHERYITATEVWAELEESDTYQYAEGPMMNYWYPINETAESDGWRRHFDPIDAAGRLGNVSLCIVLVNGEYGLALTGGGMDMTWDIVTAFIALGMAPPIHFCDLPDMAMQWTEREQRALEAVRYSLEWERANCERTLSRVNEMASRMSGGQAR